MEMYFKLKFLEEIIGYILLFLVLGFWLIWFIFLAIIDKFNKIRDKIREKRDNKKEADNDKVN